MKNNHFKRGNPDPKETRNRFLSSLDAAFVPSAILAPFGAAIGFRQLVRSFGDRGFKKEEAEHSDIKG